MTRKWPLQCYARRALPEWVACPWWLPADSGSLGQIFRCRRAHLNRAVASQDGYAGSRFLEQQHHCLQQPIDEFKHGNHADEFQHGNNADGTTKGRTERRHTSTRMATRHGKATSVLVLHQPRVRLFTVGQVPVGKTTRRQAVPQTKRQATR